MTIESTSSTVRHDGWTSARQVAFLDTLAATGMVRHAAKAAGMSHEAAYNLRHRANGAAFRIGWDAALLMARARLADTLMERAIEGQKEMVVRDADAGTRTHRRHDNRMALSLLARLDRLAAASPPRGDGQGAAGSVDMAVHATYSHARVVTRAWDEFIALVEQGGDEAALAAFLDRHRTGQKNASGPCQLRGGEDIGGTDQRLLDTIEETFDVWTCEISGEYRTNFPPPPGFDGEEFGPQGTGIEDWDDYERTLTPREAAYEDALASVERTTAHDAIEAARRERFQIGEGHDELGTPGMTLTLADVA